MGRHAATSAEGILEATRTLIAEGGPANLTMSAIADAAGVSRPTVYKWFPGKTEVLDALASYEEARFDERLAAVVEAKRSPARKLDAAVRLLVTYLDGLMGPDPIAVDPAFALHSLAASIGPHTTSFVRLLGDALDVVPAVGLGRLTREQAADLLLRVAYSHYLVPHPEPDALLANLRAFAGLPMSRSKGGR